SSSCYFKKAICFSFSVGSVIFFTPIVQIMATTSIVAIKTPKFIRFLFFIHLVSLCIYIQELIFRFLLLFH
ncbi:MAG: hypothetical protein E7H37_07825, partial [Enterococcus faecalis]|nr:hypothetical protein [Enterococcus faecalis]